MTYIDERLNTLIKAVQDNAEACIICVKGETEVQTALKGCKAEILSLVATVIEEIAESAGFSPRAVCERIADGIEAAQGANE